MLVTRFVVVLDGPAHTAWVVGMRGAEEQAATKAGDQDAGDQDGWVA